MSISRKYRKMRRTLHGGKRKRRKTRRKRGRKRMRGGGCACASSNMAGGRRRRNRRSRRRSRRNSKRRKKRLRKMKGGGALRGSCVNWKCDMPSNIGHKFTGYKYNTKPFLPDPKSLNSNIKIQKGGHTSGGSNDSKMITGVTGIPRLMHEFGLGDLLLSYYKGTNAALDTKHRWDGAKLEVGADPMNQPRLIKDYPLPYSTPNVPQFYDSSAETAAKMSLKM